MVATAARTLLESLDRIPNEDSRTKISILAVDSCLHFFSLPVRGSSLLGRQLTVYRLDQRSRRCS